MLRNQKTFVLSWDDIEEELDEIDFLMLREIENDPDCHEFVNEKDIDWD